MKLTLISLLWIALVSLSVAWLLMVSALKTAETLAKISLVKQEAVLETMP